MDPTSRRLFMGSGSISGFFIAATTGPATSFPYNYYTGAMTAITGDGTGTIGTFIRNTITMGATTYTVRGVYDVYFGDLGSGSGGYFVFAVNGNNTGTWWSTITVNNITYSRTTDCVTPAGQYYATDNITYWRTPAVVTVFPATPKTFSLSSGVTYDLVLT